VPDKGLTTVAFAEFLGISPDKVRAWILRGELGAVNVALDACRRPQWVILPHHVKAWEEKRLACKPVKVARRKKQAAAVKDYFPD
jgi:hypothetical protein